ncbi:NERD domain-containing protein [Shinella sp.]|jgi:hypothetical protein|uniref:NERD domain-containing protein n=1 Tax=Shinella sp. TaxID=1870904 RepID=UPI003F70C1EA
MPAYRSSAEAEIRDAVVARIRECRPNARIIHEINVSTYGPNRIDLIAVDREEIIACEIKSAKDKLDRLDAQVSAMKGVAHHVIAAIHEKFLKESKTHEQAAHYQRDGEFYLKTVPDNWHHGIETWVFPKVRRCLDEGWNYDRLDKWDLKPYRPTAPLPAAAIDMLWRDELRELCGILRVSAPRKCTMPEMVSALRWHCNGRELTRGICGMLRARRCVEADPEIFEKIAA